MQRILYTLWSMNSFLKTNLSGRQKKNYENKITKLINHAYAQQLEYKTVQSMEMKYSQLFVFHCVFNWWTLAFFQMNRYLSQGMENTDDKESLTLQWRALSNFFSDSVLNQGRGHFPYLLRLWSITLIWALFSWM